MNNLGGDEITLFIHEGYIKFNMGILKITFIILIIVIYL